MQLALYVMATIAPAAAFAQADTTAPPPAVAAPAPAEPASLQAAPDVPLAAPAPPSLPPPPSAAVVETTLALPDCDAHAAHTPCLPAEDAYLHDGLYFRFDLGFGYMSFFGTGPVGHAALHGITNGTLLLALGGTPAPGLVIAGTIHIAGGSMDFHGAPHRPEGSANINGSQLGVLLDWYPNPNDGFHIGALAGFGVIGLDDSQIANSQGVAFSGALMGGYDWWIGPQWSLGISALVSFATSAKIKEDNGGADTGYRLSSLMAGVQYGITLH
jgi:hypothetical protein